MINQSEFTNKPSGRSIYFVRDLVEGSVEFYKDIKRIRPGMGLPLSFTLNYLVETKNFGNERYTDRLDLFE